MSSALWIRLRRWHRRRIYCTGATLSRFIAPDIRRDIEIVDAAEIEAGIVIARVRTWNVLYATKGLVAAPPYSEPAPLHIDAAWEWKGASWGGGPFPMRNHSSTSEWLFTVDRAREILRRSYPATTQIRVVQAAA